MAASANLVPLDSRRVRLTLEAPVETPDNLGGASIAYQPVITLWARLAARSGSERVIGGRLEGASDTRVIIRWRGGIDATMRFTLDARVFAIRSVFDPDGRKRDLVCLCEEISP